MNNNTKRSGYKNTALYRFIRASGQSIRKNVKKFFFTRRLKNSPPVFVFQMGKVASSSIFESLKQQYSGAVGHAHHIGEDNWMSVQLHEWYQNGNPIKIISPVREPVGRNISGFFQQFEDYTGIDVTECKLTHKEIKRYFLDKFDHQLPLRWFDEMMNTYFNIDVYAIPFPSNGHCTYSNKNVDLLVLRIDISDAEKEKAIREFLDFPNFILEKSNVGSQKEYNALYQEFKNNLKLPDEYIETMCNSKYFKHFYSASEIEKTKKQWS